MRAGRLAVTLLAVGLTAAGCGKEKSGSGESPSPSPTTQPDDGEISVRAAGLQLIGAGYGGDVARLRPLNESEKGTAVALLAVADRGELIAFDDEASQVESLTDDQGSNLLAGEMTFGRPGFEYRPAISADHRALMCRLAGGSLPAGGAGRIQVRAVMVFRYSPSGQHIEARVQNAALRKNTQLQAGPFALTVVRAGEAGWGDDKMQVVFQSAQDLTGVADIRFLDAEGKPIASRRGAAIRNGFGGRFTWDIECGLAQKTDRATVVVEYWGDATTRRVPVRLTVGMGL
ncbi:MAG: hypothetical protein BIFFINMI_00734 [Phycisphaerae bacterium]|nr:hypothetical protein [Phycisphaerae bacterium]